MENKETEEYQNLRIQFFKLLKDKKYNISLEVALLWLGQEYNHFAKKNLLQRYLRVSDYGFIEVRDEDEKGDFIIKKEGKKQPIFFSNRGFKRLCLALRSVKSSLIYDHFIECEEGYIRALEQTDEENKKEYKELMDKCNNTESELEKLKEKNSKLFSKNEKLDTLCTNLKGLDLQHNNVKAIVSQNSNDFASDGSPEMKFLMYLLKRFGTQIYVSIVDPAYVNKSSKKSKSSNNSDDDTELDEKFDILDPEDTPYEDADNEWDIKARYYDTPMYYSLSNTVPKPNNHSKMILSVPVVDKKHGSYVKECLKNDPDTKTKYKSIFNTTYNDIKSFADDYISNEIYEEIKEKYIRYSSKIEGRRCYALKISEY